MLKDIEKLRHRVEAIHRQYDAHFAGQPRISRDPSLMESMLIEADSVLNDLGDADADLKATIAKNRALYVQELAGIKTAQAGGPVALEVHHVASWAGFTFDRYQRHFAGKSRATRDLGLLQEMVADLERLDHELVSLSARVPDSGELQNTRKSIAENIELYRAEQSRVAEARGAGTLEDQSGILAEAANNQFALYRDHFAGKNRLSRRTALIERMVGNLAQIQDRMRALRSQGLHSEQNDGNIETVEGRLTAYREEAKAISSAKQSADIGALVQALGEAANAVFADYRAHFAGHDRATRDPSMLSRMCDQLFDLGRQMDDLDRARPHEANQHNLSIVMDHLRLYVREYGLTSEAARQ